MPLASVPTPSLSLPGTHFVVAVLIVVAVAVAAIVVVDAVRGCRYSILDCSLLLLLLLL